MERKKTVLIPAGGVALAAAAGALVRRHGETGAEPASEDVVSQPAPDAGEAAARDPNVTRSELYKRAKQLGIEGRSTMTKDELARAIAERETKGAAA